MTIRFSFKTPPNSPLFFNKCQSFFYNIGGEKAQDLLLEYGKCGDFLVRPSESNKNDYTLSVHRGDRVTHVKIPIRDGEFVLPNDLTFNNLRSLVDHLTQENVFFEPDGTVIEIRTPFVVKAMDRSALIGCDRYFHPMITGKDAEILLNSEPNGTFLLRESGSTPGEFVIGVKCSGEILHIKIFNVNGRFRVGQYGDAFKSISDLINNYMMFNMFQTNGQPVPLLYPLQSTSFFATMIDERIEYLKSASKKYPNKDNAAEEFDALQNDKEPNVFNSKREGRKQENEIKNRYKNVLPYDDSRIRLRMDSDDTKQSDYINANYIEVLHDDKFKIFDGFDKKYISTQGCLPNTIGAFWRMVWQENSKTIVMITKEVERGKVKCARYWPELDQELETGFAGEIIVKNVVEELDDNFVRREFDLTNKKTEEVRRIIHFQFLFWDDYDYPANSVQCYMDEVNKTSDEMEGEKGPMIVHCSAGIGRTGTYMVIDILIGVLKRNGLNWPIDVAKAVRMVREQRDQMVQNENQYKFIYEAVRAFIHSMMKNDFGKKNGTHATLLNNFNQLQIHGNDKATTPSPCSIANSPNPFSHGGSGSSSSSYSNNSVDLNCQISFTDPQPIVLSPPPRPKKKRPPPIPEHSNNSNQNYVNSN